MPYDSLDDFASGVAVPQNAGEPPASRSLRFSGEVEVLKPLVSSEHITEDLPVMDDAAVSPSVPPEAIVASWGRRSLVWGASFAMATLVLAAGIFFIAVYRPRVEPVSSGNDVAVDQRSEDIAGLGQPDQQPGDITGSANDLSDPLTPANAPSVSDETHTVRSVVRRNLSRRRVIRAVYRPRSYAIPPQIVESGFVPTTRIIYVEKGEIKSRIEPQLTSGYKKSDTLPN